jgi:ubiquinone/menaquinone biosynthesis C-methylase UbiE
VGSPGGLALPLRAVELAGLAVGACILDVACGCGEMVERLNVEGGYRALGVDLSMPILREGRDRRAGLPLVQAAGDLLPLADESQDAVLVGCALALMGAESILTETQRVLKPGGRLILSDTYSRNPDVAALAELAQTCCLGGVEPREQVQARLDEHGFALALWEDHPEALKQWLGQMIFAQGSAEAVYGRMASGPVDAAALARAIRSAKLSYYLLVAEKENG